MHASHGDTLGPLHSRTPPDGDVDPSSPPRAHSRVGAGPAGTCSGVGGQPTSERVRGGWLAPAPHQTTINPTTFFSGALAC